MNHLKSEAARIGKVNWELRAELAKAKEAESELKGVQHQLQNREDDRDEELAELKAGYKKLQEDRAKLLMVNKGVYVFHSLLSLLSVFRRRHNSVAPSMRPC